MFVDLWFNLCCTKRHKQEQVSDMIRPPQESPGTDPLRSNNQEKFVDFVDVHRNQLQNSREKKSSRNCDHLKISIENKMEKSQQLSPTDQFLNLNDENQFRPGSFENLQKSSLDNSNHKINEKQQYLTQTVNGFNNEKFAPLLKKSASTQTFGNEEGVKKKIKKDKEKEKEKEGISQRRNVKIWEPEEDYLLKQYYIELNGNWREIAKKIVGRNMNQCSQRWRRINPMESKSKWSFEIDQKILSLVNQMGKRWVDIAKCFPGRTGKQIRERFLNKLDPNLKFEAWNKQEDETILRIYKLQGPKWSVIAQELQGRSENMVKNRFYSYIRRVQLGQQNPYQIVFTPPILKNGQMDLESPSSGDSQKMPYSEGSVNFFFKKQQQYSSGSSGSTFTNWDEDDIWKDDEYNGLEDQFNLKANINNHLEYLQE